MSETAIAPPATGELFKALAELQARLPKIRKGETAKVRSDKGNYEYKYADLTDVSEEVLPLMGSLGLAFTARPTLASGQFVLAYSLVHVSGEREDGIYPLPTNGTPQAIGSAITYARRYCLCAVTGVAPGGDDDDAGEAESHARQSAADAFENARPQPMNQGPRREITNGGSQQRGQVSRPAQQATAQPSAEVSSETVQEWALKIDEITSADDADRTDADLRDVFKAGHMNPTTANAIRKAIRAKRETVAQSEMAGAQ